jgi:heptosyltransferase-2
MSAPRILVVRGGAIGDFILTLPAIGALRERWPEAQIEVLGYPHIIELAHRRQYADAVRNIEARAMAGFFVPLGPLDDGLREYFGSLDVVVSYLFDPDQVFAENVRRSGARQVIEASPRPETLPAAMHYCRPLEALAIYVKEPVPRVFPSDADRAVALEFLARSGREPILAIHPGSGSQKKNWPVKNFGALGRWAIDELAVQLVVVQGEADEVAVAALRSELGTRPVMVARGLTLVALAAVLERCAVFVGNDSGITHLAAAVGTPTVALFGPASLPVWEPQGKQVQVVRFGDGDLALVRQAVGKSLLEGHLS